MYVRKLIAISLCLIAFLISSTGQGVTLAPQAVTLFTDDFESGITRAWDTDTSWSIESDGGSDVLDGVGHAWATLLAGRYWTDYTFDIRVKTISGAVQFNFRMSDDRGRYIVGMHPGGLYLRREAPWEYFSADLDTNNTGFASDTWYILHISANLRHITVSVNNEAAPRLDYTDYSPSILWQGTLGLEVVGGEFAHARFDDLVVTGVPAPKTSWVKTGGPIGGLGYDVRYALPDLQTMYVTDNYSGVNKSVDGGLTWFTSNRGIVGRTGTSGDAIPVFSLTVDPNNPNIVWAGLKDVKGIYKSTNAGQLWNDVTPPISEAQFVFRGFTVQEGNSNIVFAAGEIPTNLDGKEFNMVQGRVYRSDNGGISWTPIWDGDNLARYVIQHPTLKNTLYVSTGIFDREAYNSNCSADIVANPSNRGGVGVLKSTDGGATWTELDRDNGLTDLYVGSLVMHPTNPNILLAGTGNNSCSRYVDATGVHEFSGVFLTENGGQTWTQTLTDEIITSVEFSPSNPDIAYAGGREHFFISENGGHTWDLVAGQSHPWGPPGVVAGFPIDILVHPTQPLNLFANNYGGGNVKSDDGGVHWQLASEGYTGALMFDVSIHPENPAVVYTSARSGAFRSRDGGSRWEGINTPPATQVETYAVAIRPDNPQIVLVTGELGGQVYYSDSGGDTWTQVYKIPGVTSDVKTFGGLKRVEFAPSNPDIVYGGSCRGVNLLDPAVEDSYGVFKSTNGGQNWVPARTNIEKKCINDLAIHPTNPNIVYAATASDGLYKTTNGGASWFKLNALSVPSPGSVMTVAIRPDQPNVVFAGTPTSGVYFSPDGGTTWNPSVAGMEPNDAIWSIVVDPVNPDVVWAGSNRTGVYRWDLDQGLWTHVNDGLRTRAVTDLAISTDGSVLYATTWGEGVFRLGEVTLAGQQLFLPMILGN